jgi:hypothetical protein
MNQLLSITVGTPVARGQLADPLLTRQGCCGERLKLAPGFLENGEIAVGILQASGMHTEVGSTPW